MIDNFSTRAATWAALAAVLALTGCDRPPASPESAFRAFRDALRYGDNASACAMLAPQSLEDLQAISQAEPCSALRVAWVPSEADIDTLERVSIDNERAVLRLTTYQGYASDITLLRADPGWTIVLDVTQVAEWSQTAQNDDSSGSASPVAGDSSADEGASTTSPGGAPDPVLDPPQDR